MSDALRCRINNRRGLIVCHTQLHASSRFVCSVHSQLYWRMAICAWFLLGLLTTIQVVRGRYIRNRDMLEDELGDWGPPKRARGRPEQCIISFLFRFLPARSYANAGLAVVVCPSVCPSVCHKPVFYTSDWTDRAGSLACSLSAADPTLCCTKIQISPTIMALHLGSCSKLCSKLWPSVNFATARRMWSTVDRRQLIVHRTDRSPLCTAPIVICVLQCDGRKATHRVGSSTAAVTCEAHRTL